ncbi:MAG: hypothetical protein JXA71_04255 [Chitinispirillaceae bacterium]|nr:hypothetical protein [Chitinispirillaceae bacterium]
MKKTTAANVILLAAAGAMVLLCLCGKRTQEGALARIGASAISQNDVNAFGVVTRFLSGFHDESGLHGRNPVDALILVQSIFQHVGRTGETREFEKSRELQWRKASFISHLYSREALQKNLGQSEEAIRSYYHAHENDFVKTERHDSMGVLCTTRTIPPFDSVHALAAEKLFFSTYQPDSGSPSLYHRKTFRHFRERGYREHFLKKFYADKFGAPLPDSVETLVGPDGILDSADIALFRSWFRDGSFSWLDTNPQALITMGIRFRLFAEKAEKSGFLGRDDVCLLLSWAWRLEVARRHIITALIPVARQQARLDTSMVRFSYWDERGNPGEPVDSQQFAGHRSRLDSESVFIALDSLLYGFRSRAGVVFLQSEWMDKKTLPPAVFLRKADSLRDAGNPLFAEEFYGILINEYPGTPQGMVALVEQAKLQTEDKKYAAAIRNYRRFLLFGNREKNNSAIMFTIGYIYDQYLNQPEMAEIHFRWVLKHAPESGVAGDAEVMLQHLGEPMPGVDELRAEAVRQGR